MGNRADAQVRTVHSVEKKDETIRMNNDDKWDKDDWIMATLLFASVLTTFLMVLFKH